MSLREVTPGSNGGSGAVRSRGAIAGATFDGRPRDRAPRGGKSGDEETSWEEIEKLLLGLARSSASVGVRLTSPPPRRSTRWRRWISICSLRACVVGGLSPDCWPRRNSSVVAAATEATRPRIWSLRRRMDGTAAIGGLGDVAGAADGWLGVFFAESRNGTLMRGVPSSI